MREAVINAIAHRDYSNFVRGSYIQIRQFAVARGRGYFLKRKIILPEWVSEYDRFYQIYYAVHELCHCMIGYEHNEAFKMVEDCLLNLWDIKILRMRVYPKKLFREGREILNIIIVGIGLMNQNL